ncbi:MAG TPA: hypothetical protein VFH80_16685 [Solirubrobacteraceae bacterium]|nr:hypothetical protein [Solirubrobacteraceae bacterium]
MSPVGMGDAVAPNGGRRIALPARGQLPEAIVAPLASLLVDPDSARSVL